jgi:hypothetical protein
MAPHGGKSFYHREKKKSVEEAFSLFSSEQRERVVKKTSPLPLSCSLFLAPPLSSSLLAEGGKHLFV